MVQRMGRAAWAIERDDVVVMMWYPDGSNYGLIGPNPVELLERLLAEVKEREKKQKKKHPYKSERSNENESASFYGMADDTA